MGKLLRYVAEPGTVEMNEPGRPLSRMTALPKKVTTFRTFVSCITL